MKSTSTICLIGGHLSPALAVAEQLRKEDSTSRLWFIGRKDTFVSQDHTYESVEKEVMEQIVDVVHLLPIQRLHPQTFLSFIRNVRAISSLFAIEKPDCVVSFGGYVAAPVAVAAVLNRIPLVLHEQTHHVGFSNRIVGAWAKKVCVSYPEMATGKHIYTGFPLRQDIIHPPQTCSLPILDNNPIIYVTGGTTGAVSINELIFPLLRQLTDKYTVVHQTGYVSMPVALQVKDELPKENRDRYIVSPYIQTIDASWLMHNASVLIGRSGANTVFELSVTKIPSVLIPLPISANGEQQTNAEWLQQYAPTTICAQKSLTSPQLLEAIESSGTEPKKPDNFPKISLDGTKNLTKEIRLLLQ